ncbi:MAG: dTMP kinase [Candidatus Zapsychrus exili]|nr:dTMP kinase [Candidatus Zapsychrus exili]
MAKAIKGKFITFEGSEGSGKSTQIKLLQKYLKSHKKSIVFLREPGGAKISEKIRKILLDVNNKEMSDECETLLYMAARAQLVYEKILPALKEGKIVLCDRFLDSTLAYQGYGNGVDISMIKKIGVFATKEVTPDLTFVFDIEAKKGLARINGEKDRIEKREISYHNKVRNGFLDIAHKESKRVKVICSDKAKGDIHTIIVKYIEKLLGL